MSTFKMVGVDDETDDEMESIDVDALLESEDLLKVIQKNSVDIGNGERAFCIDLFNYREIFRDVCNVDMDAREKSDMSCNPLGWISDKLGLKEHGIAEKDDERKYCIIYDKGSLSKHLNGSDRLK